VAAGRASARRATGRTRSPVAGFTATGERSQVGAAKAWDRVIARTGFRHQLISAESDGLLVVADLMTGSCVSLGKREYENTKFMFATNDGLYTIETDGSMYRIFIRPGGGIEDYDRCTAEIEKVFREQGKPYYRRLQSRQINGAAATRPGILEGLAWLQSNATKNDLVAIYVGCHGATNAEQGWGIVTADGAMVWGRELKSALGKLPCQVLAMVETCTSGGFAMAHKNDIPVPPNVTALCACGEDETTDNQLDLAVAEALYGRADFNHDGAVSLDELIQYTKLRYREWWPITGKSIGSQTPVIVKSPTASGAQPLTAVSPALGAAVHDGTLWSALIEGRDGADYKVHFLGWSAKPGRHYFLADRAAANAVCLPGEPPVLVERGGKWVPAQLISQAEGKSKVGYLSSGQEETVGSERVRYPFVGRRW
jgi:hypothetical protein